MSIGCIVVTCTIKSVWTYTQRRRHLQVSHVGGVYIVGVASVHCYIILPECVIIGNNIIIITYYNYFIFYYNFRREEMSQLW